MTGPPSVLQHRSLVDLAVDEVQRLIFAGAYNLGDPRREQQLTDKFAFSRAPLREALRVLEQRGIVEQLPRRGVRVVSLSARDGGEIYGLRDALERCEQGSRNFLGPVATSDPGAVDG